MRNEREYSTSDFGIQKEHLENQAVGGRNETAQIILIGNSGQIAGI